MGFDKVFDVNFGADITSIIEAEELLERLEKNENLPYQSHKLFLINYILLILY